MGSTATKNSESAVPADTCIGQTDINKTKTSQSGSEVPSPDVTGKQDNGSKTPLKITISPIKHSLTNDDLKTEQQLEKTSVKKVHEEKQLKLEIEPSSTSSNKTSVDDKSDNEFAHEPKRQRTDNFEMHAQKNKIITPEGKPILTSDESSEKSTTS